MTQRYDGTMTRALHTISRVVGDIPDALIDHPVLGQYLERTDLPIGPECKPCAEAAKKEAANQDAPEEVEGLLDFSDIIEED